jgi:hypothetical protein
VLAPLLAILLIIIVSSANLSQRIYESQTTTQKGLTILQSVAGIDVSKYTVTQHKVTSPENWSVKYDVIYYTFESAQSSFKATVSFANGSLTDVQIYGGTPTVTYSRTDVIETAKKFLSNYQAYAGNTLYSELKTMLDHDDQDLNRTSGTKQLEYITRENDATFRWYYSINGTTSADKSVLLTFNNGYPEFFSDNWERYKIGSIEVNLSGQEATDIALEITRSHFQTLKIGPLNSSNIRYINYYFDYSRDANVSRGNYWTLYPVCSVGVALDKWYGNLYGLQVYIWADTKQVRNVQEAWSMMTPP